MSGPGIGHETVGRGLFGRDSPQRPPRRVGLVRRGHSLVPPDNDLTLDKDLPIRADEHQVRSFALMFLIWYQKGHLVEVCRLFGHFRDAGLRIPWEGA